jgi:hypothetical protein
VGNINEYLPYFVYTFSELGKLGIGQNRSKFYLKSVQKVTSASGGTMTEVYNDKDKKLTGHLAHAITLEMLNPRDLQDGAGGFTTERTESTEDIKNNGTRGKSGEIHSLTLQFLTPARIKHRAEYCRELDFKIFIHNLLKKISVLDQVYCRGEDQSDIFRNLMKKAEEIRHHHRLLEWVDWERYSTRQKTDMLLGGLVGKITFTGELTEFYPYIKMGEYIHAGKNTGFGLGKYRITGQEVR